jgi:hypothetical protein
MHGAVARGCRDWTAIRRRESKAAVTWLGNAVKQTLRPW